ncbi:preprotein translocase subunit YajC [Candidatus Pelagibacter sp.]|jgi:preprotein translocase subunit YajC|nr:preprotein translocase subunit YajC [Candidatus Pelagibacter sp.]|tara:strand:+ start:340 stop:639 length:300 start_codon:yes stop_codon:yes gene_type:complete
MEGSGIGQFIPLILIFVIFYFFLIRPQQKKVKEHKAMVENLKRGDKVITSGGITGTVERLIDNDKVEVEIADNVKVEIVKATGIQGLLNNQVNSQEVKK